ncbi:ATP-dependent DNA helicase Q1-like isoform X2 [Anthonomus grandis grandis]|uniref:ATP-dependent DNA helicase Q1-like isoform X2 n=1 Tax=Anthonomus grandis grandis TaxID=2921223 RepID=UPI002165BD49|nr:ATP-dependent DNA helicase Q1-like isoform X2 [Anthonomus grandis grandis]
MFPLSSDAYIQKQNKLDQELQKLQEEHSKISAKIKIIKQEKEELRVQYALSCLKNKRSKASEWTQDYSWSESLKQLLREKFQFGDFRPQQLAAINATLSGKDVLVIMPTAGGKSLIYQMAAAYEKKLTVVISPLISLIEDQLRYLNTIGMKVATINSEKSSTEKQEVMRDLKDNKLNIILLTPEYFAKTKIFMNNLTKLYKERNLGRFVIDEVHCCSNWGHDFRTDYMALSLLKSQFPDIPILGLTATATPAVIVDIQKILEIPDSVIITSPYNRPNLFYKVVHKSNNQNESLKYVAELLRNKYNGKSGIIYVATQREAENISQMLRQEGLAVSYYHAGMEPHVKQKVQRKWTGNVYQAIVATVAFGMGIDKPDVKFVIHYSAPRSLEGFYQESGRAGRDGSRADCILMYNLSDWLRNFAIAGNKKDENSIMDTLQYCIETFECRRKLIAKHFDDEWQSTDCNSMCDNCKLSGSNKDALTYNLRDTFNALVNIIKIASKKDVDLTLKKFLDSWFSNCKPKFSRDQAEKVIAFLLSKQYLIVRRGYNLVKTIPYICTNHDGSSDQDILMKTLEVIPGLNQYSEKGL